MPSLPHRLLFASLLLVSGLVSPLRAQGDVLYGVSFGVSEVFIIDLGTGAATLVGGTTLLDVAGIAFDDTGTLYGITDHTFPPPGTTNLYILDPWAGTATLVGTASFGGGEGALVHDPGAGLFYSKHNLTGLGGGGPSLTLMTIDPGTGAGTLIGNMGLGPGSDVSGMALLADGTLLGLDSHSTFPDQLVSIDKVTGVASVIGPTTGVAATSLGGLAVDPATGTVYLSDAVSLFEVDPGTGAVTLIGAHGATITGLSFGPAPGSSCLIGLETSSTLYDVSHIDGTGSFPRSTVDGLGGLALSPGGTLYALRRNPVSALYTLNPLNGAATLVGPTGTPIREGGLDFDPVSGDLYGAQGGNGGDLYTLDTGTGAASLVGTVLDEFGQPIDLSALAFDAVGNLYGMKTTTAPEIYRINPATAAVFDRVPIPGFTAGPQFSGMEFDDVTGTLYAVIGDQLVTLNPTTGATSILGTTPIRSALEVVGTCPPPACVIPQSTDSDVLISIIGTVGGGGHLKLSDKCGELDPTRIGRGEVTLGNAPSHAPTLFLSAFPPVDPVVYPWGTLVAQPAMAASFVTDAFGEVRLELPAGLGPATVLAQWAVLDPQASAGIALSHGIRIEWR